VVDPPDYLKPHHVMGRLPDEYFAAANKVDQLYTTHLTTSPA